MTNAAHTIHLGRSTLAGDPNRQLPPLRLVRTVTARYAVAVLDAACFPDRVDSHAIATMLLAMKFYPESRLHRLMMSVIMLGTAFGGMFLLIRHRWFLGGVFCFLGLMQLRSLWTRYWEITPDGLLRSQGYGFKRGFHAQELCYAGPVRVRVSFPVSRKTDIQLQTTSGATHFARIVDRQSFFGYLERMVPQAEVKPF